MPPGTRRRDRGGGLGYGVGDSRRWRVEFRRVGALLQFDPDLLGAPGLVVVSGETLALIRGCGGFTGAPFTGCFTGPQPTKSKCRAEFSGLRAYFFPGTGSLGMMSRRKHYLTAAVIALPLGAVLLFGQAAQNPGISVRELRCEYMSNPQGIDVSRRTACLSRPARPSCKRTAAICGTRAGWRPRSTPGWSTLEEHWPPGSRSGGKCRSGAGTERPHPGANRHPGRWGCCRLPTGRASTSVSGARREPRRALPCRSPGCARHSPSPENRRGLSLTSIPSVTTNCTSMAERWTTTFSARR